MYSKYPCPRLALSGGDEGAYPFPDHLTRRGHFEHTAGCTFADQHVSVGLSFRPGDVAAEKLLLWFGGVLPCDAVVLGIDLNDSRIGHPVAVHPVIEDLHVAIR